MGPKELKHKVGSATVLLKTELALDRLDSSFNFNGLQLIYNAVLVSGIRQSDSVIYPFFFMYAYSYSFSDSFLLRIITEYRVEFHALYTRSLLVIYLIYSRVCMFIPSF